MISRLKQAGFLLFFMVMSLIFVMIDLQTHIPESELVPNFSRIKDIEERKRSFFDYMRPIIELENNRVQKKRKRLLFLYKKKQRGEKLTDWDWKWINQYAREFRVKKDQIDEKKVWEELKKRIDIIPVSLALAQSANESAWGTSRFALQGSSMFGQLTFSKSDQGLVPERRDSGARHRVAKYHSVAESVRSYIKNLNTHPAYGKFRELRYQAREKGEEPKGYVLAKGLLMYSERGEEYVDEIEEIILLNKSLMGIY
jgi:Bax protein